MTLLPDPEPRPRTLTVISVDDHLIEPPDLFEGRMPARLAERAPRLVESDDGSQAWVYEGSLYPNVGLNAVVGRPVEEWTMEPARFDEMRKGCYDIHARVADMDTAGIWASLCFPSLIAGFAGVVFSKSKDPDLGLACVRAWNDWHHEVWAGTYPERIIPLQITWLLDPAVAAHEVRRNAARGFKALSFPENPANIDLPSVHTSYWDPLLAACEETGTVVCLHTGSAGGGFSRSPEAPLEQGTSLFPVCGMLSTAEWLWAGIPLRFPRLDIALSEGGIGWVPMFLDRLDYVMAHSGIGGAGVWHGDVTPSEAVQRNFWFCSIDDPTALRVRDRIGVDHIMVESDYPHADSSWPDTQELLARRFDGLPADEVAAMTHLNAARLFRHPLPPTEWKEAVRA
ncbi:MAG TPA: amidohydrolase family protein [Acidimicrobiales bacterium]|nr:amidohydrolase family protein [Acidimicrobiales bacterium]